MEQKFPLKRGKNVVQLSWMQNDESVKAKRPSLDSKQKVQEYKTSHFFLNNEYKNEKNKQKVSFFSP